METPFVKVRIKNAGKRSIKGALVTCLFSAALPLLVDSGFLSRTLYQQTMQGEELVVEVPPSSWLASRGVDPPTIKFVCEHLGLNHEVFIPDEDCDLDDILQADNPDLPIVEPAYITATRWLHGIGSPTLQLGLGRDGDYYLDTQTTDTYAKAQGEWVFLVRLGTPLVIDIDDVEGLQAALDALLTADDINEMIADALESLAKVAGTGQYGDLLGIPTAFPPAAHTQSWGSITGTPNTLAGYGILDGITAAGVDARFAALVGAAPAALDTVYELAAELQNSQGTVAALTTLVGTKITQAQGDARYSLLGHTHNYGSLQNIPTAFAPSGHAATHASDGTDPLTPAQIGAAAVVHWHSRIQNTEGSAALDGNGNLVLNGADPFRQRLVFANDNYTVEHDEFYGVFMKSYGPEYMGVAPNRGVFIGNALFGPQAQTHIINSTPIQPTVIFQRTEGQSDDDIQIRNEYGQTIGTLFVDGNALKFRDRNGTVTAIVS